VQSCGGRNVCDTFSVHVSAVGRGNIYFACATAARRDEALVEDDIFVEVADTVPSGVVEVGDVLLNAIPEGVEVLFVHLVAAAIKEAAGGIFARLSPRREFIE
jgi:hypothetical protein